MVVLHAFLALVSGFATMAVLVAAITVLLQKLTPGWVGEKRKTKARLHLRQSRLFVSRRCRRWLRHRMDCCAQSTDSRSRPGHYRAASRCSQRFAATRKATGLVHAHTGNSYAAGRAGRWRGSIARNEHSLISGANADEREKPPHRCFLDGAACYCRTG